MIIKISKALDNVTAFTERVCDIVFFFFTFVFLFSFQDKLLMMAYHELSSGTSNYNRALGAITITVFLYFVKKLFKKIMGNIHFPYKENNLICPQQNHRETCLNIRLLFSTYPALSLFPSALFLSFITDIQPEMKYFYDFGKWLCLDIISFLVFCTFIYLRCRKTGYSIEKVQKSFIRILWQNAFILLIAMLFIVFTTNTDKIIHDRLKAETSIMQRKYDEAVRVCNNNCAIDKSLSMLRAYALAKSNRLGGELFVNPSTGGSEILLPNRKDIKFLILKESDIFPCITNRELTNNSPTIKRIKLLQERGCTKLPVRDYELCYYLLDKDIDNFASTLLSYKLYAIDKLPRHYQEAMILYTHMRSTPLIRYNNEVMEADYLDFMNIIKQNGNLAERKAMAKTFYGATYWYYYFFGSKT